MRGNACTLIPSELASVALDGIVTSTELVYDYLLLKRLEDINLEVLLAFLLLDSSELANHWFTGTDIDGEGTVAFTLLGAKLGDLYLNTTTYNIYRANSFNSWTYQCNIKGGIGPKGPKGDRGNLGFKGPKGDPGLTASVEVNGEIYNIDDNGKIILPDYPDEVIWGNIKGTINNQTDLQEILDNLTVGDIATVDTCMGIIDELI